MGLPQRGQKARRAPWLDSNQLGWVPVGSIVTLSEGKPAQVTKAAPCARRQYVQWQWATHFDGSEAEKRTDPHRHVP